MLAGGQARHGDADAEGPDLAFLRPRLSIKSLTSNRSRAQGAPCRSGRDRRRQLAVLEPGEQVPQRALQRVRGADRRRAGVVEGGYTAASLAARVRVCAACSRSRPTLGVRLRHRRRPVRRPRLRYQARATCRRPSQLAGAQLPDVVLGLHALDEQANRSCGPAPRARAQRGLADAAGERHHAHLREHVPSRPKTPPRLASHAIGYSNVRCVGTKRVDVVVDAVRGPRPISSHEPSLRFDVRLRYARGPGTTGIRRGRAAARSPPPTATSSCPSPSRRRRSG